MLGQINERFNPRVTKKHLQQKKWSVVGAIPGVWKTSKLKTDGKFAFPLDAHHYCFPAGLTAMITRSLNQLTATKMRDIPENAGRELQGTAQSSPWHRAIWLQSSRLLLYMLFKTFFIKQWYYLSFAYNRSRNLFFRTVRSSLKCLDMRPQWGGNRGLCLLDFTQNAFF